MLNVFEQGLTWTITHRVKKLEWLYQWLRYTLHAGTITIKSFISCPKDLDKGCYTSKRCSTVTINGMTKPQEVRSGQLGNWYFQWLQFCSLMVSYVLVVASGQNLENLKSENCEPCVYRAVWLRLVRSRVPLAFALSSLDCFKHWTCGLA